jgi:hypothetical protein
MFYVYTLTNPLDNKIFYVGKGSKNRMYLHQITIIKYNYDLTRNKRKYDIIKNIINTGKDVICEKVFKSGSESECYEMEMEIVSRIGIENLTNIVFPSNSGELSKIVKERLANSEINKKRLEKIKSKEWREKCRINNLGEKNPRFGKKNSEKWKDSIRRSNKKPKTEEHKNKISHSLKNYKRTEKHCENISNSLKKSEIFQNIMKSDSLRKKISEKSKGEKNGNSKKFIFISPDGINFEVSGGLWNFIKSNKLSYLGIKKLRNGEIDNYKGWKINLKNNLKND